MNENEIEIFFSYIACVPLVCFFIYTLRHSHDSDTAYANAEARLGGFLTVFGGAAAYKLVYDNVLSIEGDWNVQIYDFQRHFSISSKFMAAIEIIAIVGAVGFLVLLFSSANKLPPLISIFSIASLILGNIFQVVFFIQLIPNSQTLFFFIYHLQLLILSASLIRTHVREQVAQAKEKCMQQSRKRLFRGLYRVMSKVSRYNLLVFAALLVIIGLLEIIFVLCGQGLDAPIKVFTDTADWTFSQQTPPPPMYYDGHYLCTVAAGGHRKVVKPLRYGTRLGETIVVNRQLCVANAFEDYIKEKLPRFHRFIRGAYDKYGYPVSKHITTPLRADIVYFLMKPLEWAFVVFLYLFDVQPEKRISRQYKYCGK